MFSPGMRAPALAFDFSYHKTKLTYCNSKTKT